jgi:hypothetical protein
MISLFFLRLDFGGGLSILPFDQMSARIAFPSRRPVFPLPTPYSQIKPIFYLFLDND